MKRSRSNVSAEIKLSTDLICTLCDSDKIIFFQKDKFRNYHLCEQCKLIFVDPLNRLSPEEEKQRYVQHNNNPGIFGLLLLIFFLVNIVLEDEGYKNFLQKLAIPLKEIIPPNSNGLDFGCGPGKK